MRKLFQSRHQQQTLIITLKSIKIQQKGSIFPTPIISIISYKKISQFRWLFSIPGLQYQNYLNYIICIIMKGFTIGELLIYDPKRPSPKRKPIEIDIQQAKILIYWPQQFQIQQKCNTVGMAQGVYSFCQSLISVQGKEEKQRELGWQTISMDECTIILSEVEEDIWIFVKLEHERENSYNRQNETNEQNGFLENTLTEKICRSFMQHLYNSLKIFYGPIRGWIFRQRLDEYQKIVSSFIMRYQQIFRYDSTLDIISYSLKDIRLIPLDINSTLKFLYFKNVLQSYDSNIVHLAVFSNGLLAFSSLSKENTEFFSNYFYGTGEPYSFSNLKNNRLQLLNELPKAYYSQKFGSYYNSKSAGLEESKEQNRSSVSMIMSKSQVTDLLGINESNKFELFQVFLLSEDKPLRINFYLENSMLFLTFYKENPDLNQIIFQNRFYHDNSDKFLVKINQSLVGVLKPNDPYKFLFHNTSTYSGKSTIREWKSIGNQVKQALQLLLHHKEGLILTLTQQGYWIYGIHRFCRILILLISSDTPLSKIQEHASKMTREYFTKAYI